MNITLVAGARPNFMKVAPIIRAIQQAQRDNKNITYRLVHTGQHYDKKMSTEFFEQLSIPEPDINLGAGSGTQAEQTAVIMMRFEKELIENKPDIVLVVGDVTSTMACAITAKKLCIDVAHVEGGLRSDDMAMPEEINRIVTDSISDHFFTTSKMADENLIKSGIESQRIHFVGNTMIDTLYQHLNKLIEPRIYKEQNLTSGKYFLITLHRPNNVDNPAKLKELLDYILKGSEGFPVVFPVHPRTQKVLADIAYEHERLIQTDPLSYLEFIYLIKNSRAIITDSGGITEESTVLGIPCMTLRNSTERPETVTVGTNILIGTDINNLENHLKNLQQNIWKKGAIPELWDGKTSQRIVSKLISLYGGKNI
ncbi:MAG: UDP-N-acetylglucosamine 2-epimerase (non-hydrolyzing) [Chitinophagaceae bacterium]|nr:UDP-N-acetylglucosamine 2-epimerase (non-hydrolyzing) [Chitinophagaceae bacterium]